MTYTVLALDHRDSMRVLLDPDDPESVPAERLTEIKLWLLRELGSMASHVMLDPEYSAVQAVEAGVVPGGVGVIVALEAQGYLLAGQPQVARRLDGWSVAQSKRLGAAGVKFLVQYDPDTWLGDAQDEVAADVIAECRSHEIPLFLEPLIRCAPEERRHKVIGPASRLGALGPDVLKLQYPGSPEACAELHAAIDVPWALLSGGDPFADFVDQVRIAREAGASGFMAGRAIWREALVDGAAGLARQRFADLVAATTP